MVVVTMGEMDTQLDVHLVSLHMGVEIAVMVVNGGIGSVLHTVVTDANALVHHVILHIGAEMHFTSF
jgi:hypothetical protein